MNTPDAVVNEFGMAGTPAVTNGTLEGILERYWGYSSFRPLQREAMNAVMSGRDSLLELPTSGGKSICFQATAQARNGLANVVSRLISLMKGQVDTLAGKGVAAACYNSWMTAQQNAEMARGIWKGKYRLLYVAPERLVGESGDGFLILLSSQPVSFIAVDEAHCISQWGHDFRPEYRQLARLRDRWPSISLHAYTATATARVRKDIVAQLGLRDATELVGSFDRPNLIYRVLARSSLKAQILDVLERHRGRAGIIYCTSRKEVEALAQWLQDSGWRARPYHAGLADDERHRNQDAFLNEDIDLIVATVAFGMGIDRSDVRFVIHAGAPQSLEHYQQESGRAGRDGLEAECVLIASGADFLKWRMMLEKNGELSEARRGLLRDMERYAASVGCRHKRLVGYFGETFAKDDCGACDYCLGELEQIEDAVTVARKVLSCVARVGQRFGAAHVTNVLRGSDSDQVRSRGHHELSVFGLLKDATIDELRGYVDQLLAHNLLQQSGEEYRILQISAEGHALLKDAGAMPDLALARQKRPDRTRLPKRARVETEGWHGVDRELFEELRVLRLEIARRRRVPPYVIFHDTTLREIARVKPKTVEELRHVYGVGDRKAADLGDMILAAVNRS